MNRQIEKKANELINKTEHRKLWHRIVKILAVAVILITAGMLTVPAITMEKKPVCGLEEHEHGPECYKEEKKLICGKEECEGHTHTDECYEEEKVLICGKEENEDHHHDESCYRTEKKLICGKEECEGHKHTKDCYKTEKVLICDKPEHKHTEACYEQSDPTADVESPAEWEQTVDNVKLTGNWDQDLIAVARTQLGYTESKQNFIWNEEGNKQGYTRYGDWYGNKYGDWCAMFISFSMHYAGIPGDEVPYEAGCDQWIRKLDALGLYEKTEDYQPVPGDLIFFDYNGDGISEHTGIVEEVLHKKEDQSIEVKTIEGNSGDCVSQKIYGLKDSSIMGFGTISRAQEEYRKKEKGSKKDDGFRFENRKMEAVVKINGLKSPIPEGTALEVKEIEAEDKKEQYETAFDKISEEMEKKNRELKGFHLFDLYLTKDGTRIPVDPEAGVEVSISFKKPLYEPDILKNKAETGTVIVKENEQPEGSGTKETGGTETGYEEVKGRYEGEKKGITQVSYKTSGLHPAVMLVSSQTETGTFWKAIRSASELKQGDTYLIVSAEGNYALTNNKGGSGPNATPVVLEPVKGNPDYYKIEEKSLTGTTKWTYRGQPPRGALENSVNYRLDPVYTTQLFVGKQDARNLQFAFDGEQFCWTIGSDYNGYRYFLNYNGDRFLGHTWKSIFSSQNYQYARTSDMLILKQVSTSLKIPDDPKGGNGGGVLPGTAVKPDYPDYVSVSGEKTGTFETKKGYLGSYASDPSTSKIEKEFGNKRGKNDFEAHKGDDGKLLTDKSVVYGGDDYQAFREYADGTFGVTLSALGQSFDTGKEVVKIPMDVLFVLDLSGSMTETDPGQSKNRAQILVDAMNSTMKTILENNPENRICAAGFNSGAKELMQLGRPKPDSTGKYLKYQNGAIVVNSTGVSVQCENGTYTQMGIAKGVGVMTQRKDTTYTTTLNGETITVPRQPVVILVSDGEPTHCTSHYMDVLNNPYYGDGGAQAYNGKGIMGYYTILSANYYKRAVGIHYDNPAPMYTVAIGMDENDFSHDIWGSDATNHFRATVLKPTAANIEKLNTIQTGYENDIEKMMYQLLKGTYKGQSVLVGAIRDRLGRLPSPHVYVPVNLKNPYRPDYNYADKAYLGNEGEKGLSDAFREIIEMNSVEKHDYEFETKNRKPISVSDPVGDGMEVKGEPVLRYNGMNYTPEKKEKQGNSILYTYKGTVPMDPHSGRTVDLSLIRVKVDTDSSGRQTVTMEIPPEALPIYEPDDTQSFYYEALPVRLIYQVGVSKTGEESLKGLKAGESFTFYTNRYTDGAHAEGTMAVSEKNKFYQGSKWKIQNRKSQNPTGTDTNSLKVSRQSQNIIHTLGNNGKLVYTKNQPDREISVEKKWLDYNGMETETDLPEQITATLYRTYVGKDGETIREDVADQFVLSAVNGWKKTFTAEELKEEAGREYLYYVTEQAVEGYNVQYSGDGISQNTPETPILLTNRYRFGEFILPESGGPGTAAFVISGMSLMALSLGIGYVLRRRRSERRER